MRAPLWLTLALALTAAPGLARAQERPADKVAVGVLRFVSSGGLFLAVERGYFRDEGVDVELKFFEAAQPIALAVVSGDADFGVTALTGGFYNLAGKGALRIIGAQSKEAKGFQGNAVLASKAGVAKGLTSVKDLPGKSVAITQVGSSFHYQLGQLARAQGFDLAKVDIKPLQSLPNMIAAFKSGQVDGMIIAPQFAKPLIASGDATLLGWYSDFDEYQFGALFTGAKTIANRRPLVERFVRAYRKGAAAYADAFTRKDAGGALLADDKAKAAAAEIIRFVYPGESPDVATPKILASIFYADPAATIDETDIARQVAWMKSEKLAEPGVEAAAILDQSFTK